MLKYSLTATAFTVVALTSALHLPAAAQRLDAQTNVPGNTSYKQPLERIVAIVNSDVVLASEVEDMIANVRRNLRQKNTQMPPDQVLEQQVLEQLVVTRLQLQLADRTGLKVDDDTLNEAIKSIADQNKVSLGEFADQLAREGIDYAAFREQIRDDILIKQLQRRELDRRVTISEREVDDFIASMTIQGRDLREYQLRHILISVPEGATPKQRSAARARAEEVMTKVRAGQEFAQLAVSYSDGQNALKGGDLGWRKTTEIPSLFATAVSRLNKGDTTKIIASPSGFHIVRIADLRDSNPFKVTETNARHILVKPTKVRPSDEARAMAQDLYDRIQRGADFSELAAQFSDDTGSGIRGGELGWAPPDQFVPEFEEVMNGLKENELSKPVRTRYGWHLIQVMERRDRDGTDQARRNQARKILGQQKSQEELELWLRRMRDEAYVEVIAAK